MQWKGAMCYWLEDLSTGQDSTTYHKYRADHLISDVSLSNVAGHLPYNLTML